MNEEQYTELKNLVQKIIDHSNEFAWQEKILFGLFGLFASALTAILINFLNTKKEKSLFRIKTIEEERRIKAKIAGEIKAIGHEIKLLFGIVQNDIILYEYNYFKGKRDTQPQSDEFIKGLVELKKQRDLSHSELRKAKINFLKILGEYRYYIDSARFDELIEVFIKIQTIESPEFIKMDLPQLNAFDLDTCLDEYDFNLKPLKDKIDSIIRFIYQNK